LAADKQTKRSSTRDQNGTGDSITPDAVEIAADPNPFNTQKRATMLYEVLKQIHENREGLWLDMHANVRTLEDNIPRPRSPQTGEEIGEVKTYAKRFKEFDDGLAQLEEQSEDAVWAIAMDRLKKDDE
jgi:hypothetical protein